MHFPDTSQIDSAINAAGANATLENSFLASVEASNEEEVMYFLIGAIVSTVVLVIPSLQHLLEETIAFSGGCSPDSLHPSQADQPSDPFVPRGRPRCSCDAPSCPRPPPHLPRPGPHHCHLDLWHALDIHCRRPCGGFGDQVHQVHPRHISLVDAMVSDRVVVGAILSLIATDNCDQYTFLKDLL